MKLIAIFSVSPGLGAAIYITPADDHYAAIASAHPSIADNPLDALRDAGYRLAHPEHRHAFSSTMAKTGYQKVPVVPLTES